MQVQNITNRQSLAPGTGTSTVSGHTDFARQLDKHSQLSQKSDTHSTDSLPAESDNIISLGALSGKKTTVAQLLLANPQLKADTWAIIHHAINKDKNFHQISAGKEIFYQPQTQEISWSDKHRLTRAEPFAAMVNNETLFAAHKRVLGQINNDNPTVSNLLSQQSDLKSQRWNIIHDPVNQNKAFTRIPGGSTVYFDPRTGELSWDLSAPPIRKAAQVSGNDYKLRQKLDDAVKPFMGSDYKDIDCYTLLVNGLKNMGVRYRGQDSLSRQLLQRAQSEGRAENAYFTGEGISEALGKKVYTHAITKVNNIDQQSRAIFQEMQNIMKKGDILSFSLASSGHTGVISQSRKQWTYINSGRLDHSINPNAPEQGVGEETLLSEINNWLKRAHRRNEALQITIGRLDTQKLV